MAAVEVAEAGDKCCEDDRCQGEKMAKEITTLE
jgi:hypothetical protein